MMMLPFFGSVSHPVIVLGITLMSSSSAEPLQRIF